jgi:hypothetical protein
MRILSSNDPRYDPSGYHYGSVWPLFTGWASVGEYRYHQAIPAYLNLRSNALLTLDGSLGHTTEVLSGDYNQTLSTGTPQQIWSAAMVVNPLLTGLLGLQEDAGACKLVFAPHVPVEWDTFSVKNLSIGKMFADLHYERIADAIKLTLDTTGVEARSCSLDFSPATGLRAEVRKVESNGRAVAFHLEQNSSDQHVRVQIPLANGRSTVEIHTKNNFEIGVSSILPPLGGASQGLRVISESWSPSRDTLTAVVEGAPGKSYEISTSDRSQIVSVEGADLEQSATATAKVRIHFPPKGAGDAQFPVVFHLTPR